MGLNSGKVMYITSSVIEKMFKYGELVSEYADNNNHDPNVECFLILLGNKTENDGIIRELVFPAQKASIGKVIVINSSIDDLFDKEIYEPIGISHSHGKLQVFLSDVDIKTIYDAYLQTYHIRPISIQKKKKLLTKPKISIESNKIILDEKNSYKISIPLLDIKDNEIIDSIINSLLLTEIQNVDELRITSYSITFNLMGDYTANIITQDVCAVCRNDMTKNNIIIEEVKVEIIPEKSCEINIIEMQKTIEKNFEVI